MKSHLVSYVGWLLLLAAFGFYCYGIIDAIRLSLPGSTGPGTYHEVLLTTIGSLQALLLANLGMLLGISVVSPTSNVARALKLNRADLATERSPAPPLDIKLTVQFFALAIYVISLIACSITWIMTDFNTDSTKVVAIIPESGKMFIGVVLAYVTAVLSK